LDLCLKFDFFAILRKQSPFRFHQWSPQGAASAPGMQLPAGLPSLKGLGLANASTTQWVHCATSVFQCTTVSLGWQALSAMRFHASNASAIYTHKAASTTNLSTRFLAAITLAVAEFVSAVQASLQAFSAKAAFQDTSIPMVLH